MSNLEPKYGERVSRVEPPIEPIPAPEDPVWTPGNIVGALILLGFFAVPIIFGIRWALGAL